MPVDAMDDPRISHEFDRLATSRPVHVNVIERLVARELKPVRPLPSNAVLVMVCVAVFVVLAIGLASPVGFLGLEKLTAVERVPMFAGLLAAVLLLATSLVEQMIPGARMRVPATTAILLAIVIVGGVVCTMFPDFSTPQFVSYGMPCLRLGVLCAIPAGGLTALLMRTGLLTDPVPAALTAGALSGMLGVGVLALHCDYQNAAHILVWHLGAVAVSLAAGLVVGGALTGWRLRNI